ncbi:MAG: RadC family protein [Bdellovibrionia bacterium]
MSELPETERPRERCLEKGARSLSFRECLALILNSGPKGKGSMGLAQDLLERPGSGLDESEQLRAFFLAMEVSSDAYLEGLSGLGDASQARLLAAFELARRYALFRETRNRYSPTAQTQSLMAVAQTALSRIPLERRIEAQEWLGFIPCYRTGEVGELCIVEQGVRTHVNIEPVELFARVLALRPHGFILVHNHPSGDLSPSLPDQEITERVSQLARPFGIRMLGHWIVAARGENWIK